jgi:hypothetical protein
MVPHFSQGAAQAIEDGFALAATNELAVAHQFDVRRIAVMDPTETGLLEVTINPEGIGVDDED